MTPPSLPPAYPSIWHEAEASCRRLERSLAILLVGLVIGQGFTDGSMTPWTLFGLVAGLFGVSLLVLDLADRVFDVIVGLVENQPFWLSLRAAGRIASLVAAVPVVVAVMSHAPWMVPLGIYLAFIPLVAAGSAFALVMTADPAVTAETGNS